MRPSGVSAKLAAGAFGDDAAGRERAQQAIDAIGDEAARLGDRLGVVGAGLHRVGKTEPREGADGVRHPEAGEKLHHLLVQRSGVRRRLGWLDAFDFQRPSPVRKFVGFSERDAAHRRRSHRPTKPVNPGTFFPGNWPAGFLYKGAVLRLNRRKVGAETNAIKSWEGTPCHRHRRIRHRAACRRGRARHPARHRAARARRRTRPSSSSSRIGCRRRIRCTRASRNGPNRSRRPRAARSSHKIYPAEQLGKAFDHYDMARDGIADMTYINPGYQPGRFPIIGAGELPFLMANAKGGSSAIDAWYRKYAAAEMKDVKFCLAFVHDPGSFHSRTKKIVGARRHQGHEDQAGARHHGGLDDAARRHQRAGGGAAGARRDRQGRRRRGDVPVGLGRAVRRRQGDEVSHGGAALRHHVRLHDEQGHLRAACRRRRRR